MTVAVWYREDTGKDLRRRIGKQPTEMGRYLEWLEMYKKGLTTGVIALRVGVKPCTVVRGVRKAAVRATDPAVARRPFRHWIFQPKAL